MPPRNRTLLALLLLAAAVGCGSKSDQAGGPTAAGGDKSAATAPAPAVARSSTAGPARPAAVEWVDPEPPGAQAQAEQAVGAEWNRDKTTTLGAAATSRLEMGLTTLVDSRTGIAGVGSAIAAPTTSLDDRLSRLGAEQTATEVTIRLPGSVLFDFDSAAIRLDAERALTDVAAVLAGYPNRPARIEGHTDSIASEAYNLDLSKRRAESVRAWLVAHGADAKRLTTAGLGESRPVADNATAAGRQKNRRVEIVIAKGG
jgi:outer membrane protein OmpA-like peptidoglycan-associated protein